LPCTWRGFCKHHDVGRPDLKAVRWHAFEVKLEGAMELMADPIRATFAAGSSRWWVGYSLCRTYSPSRPAGDEQADGYFARQESRAS